MRVIELDEAVATYFFFFFSSRRRHTRFDCDWSSDVCSSDLVLYEYDGSVEKGRPDIVVFPTTTQEVSQIVKLAAKHIVPIVGRGAGTGLSGGALARTGGVMIVFARMNRILSIDPENQRAVVQPGVVNYDLTLAAE